MASCIMYNVKSKWNQDAVFLYFVCLFVFLTGQAVAAPLSKDLIQQWNFNKPIANIPANAFKKPEIQAEYQEVMNYLITDYYTEKKSEEYQAAAVAIVNFLQKNYWNFHFFLVTEWISPYSTPKAQEVVISGMINPAAKEMLPESARDVYLAGKALLSFHPDLLKALNKWQPLKIYIATKQANNSGTMCEGGEWNDPMACWTIIKKDLRMRFNTDFGLVAHEVSHYIHDTLLGVYYKDTKGDVDISGPKGLDKYSFQSTPSQQDIENPLHGLYKETLDLFSKDISSASSSKPTAGGKIAEPSPGFMTFYSATNWAEDFADHVRYYLISPNEFKARAVAQFHDNTLLWEKWKFIKNHLFGNVLDYSMVPDPKIAVRVTSVVDMGNGDGVITAGEKFTVNLSLKTMEKFSSGTAQFVPFAGFKSSPSGKEVYIPPSLVTDFPIIADIKPVTLESTSEEKAVKLNFTAAAAYKPAVIMPLTMAYNLSSGKGYYTVPVSLNTKASFVAFGEMSGRLVHLNSEMYFDHQYYADFLNWDFDIRSHDIGRMMKKMIYGPGHCSESKEIGWLRELPTKKEAVTPEFQICNGQFKIAAGISDNSCYTYASYVDNKSKDKSKQPLLVGTKGFNELYNDKDSILKSTIYGDNKDLPQGWKIKTIHDVLPDCYNKQMIVLYSVPDYEGKGNSFHVAGVSFDYGEEIFDQELANLFDDLPDPKRSNWLWDESVNKIWILGSDNNLYRVDSFSGEVEAKIISYMNEVISFTVEPGKMVAWFSGKNNKGGIVLQKVKKDDFTKILSTITTALPLWKISFNSFDGSVWGVTDPDAGSYQNLFKVTSSGDILLVDELSTDINNDGKVRVKFDGLYPVHSDGSVVVKMFNSWPLEIGLQTIYKINQIVDWRRYDTTGVQRAASQNFYEASRWLAELGIFSDLWVIE